MTGGAATLAFGLNTSTSAGPGFTTLNLIVRPEQVERVAGQVIPAVRSGSGASTVVRR